MSISSSTLTFHNECKKWRHFRKLSQLELALEANISQRHLSYLETGRSRPSREMVMKLSEALDIPLRERNQLLQSAGYAFIYQETQLDAPNMLAVMTALNGVLKHHDPLPALVIDRFWNVRLQNQSAQQLLSLNESLKGMSERCSTDGFLNIAQLVLHPQGLKKFITTWRQTAPLFVKRLNKEADASGDVKVQSKLRDIANLAGPIAPLDLSAEALLPVLPIELNIDGIKLSLFSLISTFGTPQDITTDELRIETFYPSDQKTAEFFNPTAS